MKKRFFQLQLILLIGLFSGLNVTQLTAQSAGPDKTIVCVNTTMAATGAGSWTNVPAGVTILPVDNADPNAPALITGGFGTYTLEWTSGAAYTVDITYHQVTASGTLSADCSSASLVGSNPGGVFAGLWTASDVGVIFVDDTNPTTTASNLPVGIAVTFTWEVTVEACSQPATVILTNTTPVGVNAGGPAVEVCTNHTQNLSGSALVGLQTGEWTFLTGSGIFDDSTNPSAIVSSLVEGVNILRWTVTEAGCSASDDITLTNNSVTATASNQTVCSTTATLDGNQPLATTGLWTKVPVAAPANILSPTSPTSGVNSLQVGANTFEWTLTKGTCTNTETITITRDDLVATAGPDQLSVCATSTNLAGNNPDPGETGAWTLISGSGIIANSALNTTAVSGLDATTTNTFRWTVSRAGCVSVSEEVSIFSNAMPVNAGLDQTGVCGTSVTLTAASGDPTTGGGSGVWEEQGAPSATILTPSNYITTVNNLAPATSTFRWTVTKNGCSVWDEMIVTRSAFAADAGTDQSVCGNTATLNGSDPGPGGSGLWTIESGVGTVTNPILRNTTVTNITSFPIVARWTLTAGSCSGEFDEVTISSQGTTLAEIIGAPSIDVACGQLLYNNLTALNAPVGAEVLTWYEAAPATGITLTPTGLTIVDVTGLAASSSHTIVLQITDGVCTNLDTIVLNTFVNGTADAGTDIGGAATCLEYIQLNAVAATPPYVGTWSVVGANSQNVYIENPNAENTRIKTYDDAAKDSEVFTLRWTLTNGSCSDFDDVLVSNNYTSFAAIAAGAPDYTFGDKHIYLCAGTQMTLDGYPNTSNSNDGGWEIPDESIYAAGAFTFNGGAGNVNCVPNTPTNLRHKNYNALLDMNGTIGDFFMIWHQCGGPASAACDSRDTLFFHMQLDMTNGVAVNAAGGVDYYTAGGVKLPFSGVDQTICGTTATMSAVDPSTDGLPNTYGYWTPVGGESYADISDPSTMVYNLSVGVNTLTWTVNNGCSETSDQINVTVSAITGTDAGPDQIICPDVSTFDALPAGAGGTGGWTVKSGGGIITDITAENSTVTSLLQGRNVFLWTVTSPFCNSVDSVVIYSARPDQPDAGPDQVFCGSGNMQAVPPPSGTGAWSIVSGGATIATLNDPLSLVTPLVSPSILRWTVTEIAPNGLNCTNYDDVSVMDNTPTVAFAGGPQTVCSSAGLAANAPGIGETGKWQITLGSGLFVDDTQNVTTVNNLNLGPNTLEWTITKGLCTSTDAVIITSEGIAANINTPDQNTCLTDFAIIADNPVPAAGMWTPQGTTATISDNTAFAITVSNLQLGANTFRWRVTYGGCIDDDFITITNYTITTANAGAPQSVCVGTATMSSNVPGAGETGYWISPFVPGVTFDDSTSPTATASNLQIGNNTLRWTITNGSCSSNDDVVVSVNGYTVEAGNPQAICFDNTTLLGSDPAPGTGVWSLQSGTGAFTSPNSSTTNVTGITSTINVYRWTVTQGICVYFDDVTVTLNTPTTANAGTDQIVCADFATLDADPVTVGVGTWTKPGPSTAVITDPTNYQSTVTNLPPGGTTFTWTVTNGACISVAQVLISNNDFSTGAGVPQVLCIDNTTLDGINPGTGSGIWTIRNGSGIFTDLTYYRTTVTNVGRGDNLYRWTVTNGVCSEFAEVIVSNYSVTANAGFDDYTCDANYTLVGNDATLQSIAIPNLPAIGTWTTPGPSAITDINLFNTTVTGLNPDINVFRWTIDNGTCSDFDEVTISNDMPSVPNAGLDDIFCGIDFDENGEGYTEEYNSLNGNIPDGFRGETGIWTLVAGQGTFVDPTTTPNARVTDLGHFSQLTGPDYWNQNPTINTFRWTITYKACSLYDEVSIVNAAPFAADAGPDQTVCYDEANLNAIDHGSGAQSHLWTELNPGGTSTIANPDEFNSYVSDLQSLTTTFRWTKENTLTFGGTTLTCTIYDDTEVTRPPVNLGRPNAGSNQTVCSEEADMTASSADYGFTLTPPQTVSGQWSILLGNTTFADLNSHSTHVTNLAYRTNIFRWTVTYDDGLGFQCISTDDVDITNALPSNANAGPDQFVCTNTAILSSDRPTRGSGEWSVIGGGGTISNTTCQNFSCNVYVSNMGTGENTFLWTMSNSYTDPASGTTETCTLTDEISVWNNSVTAVAGIPITTCNDTTILAATAPGVGESGVWTVTGGAGILDTPSAYNSQVTNLSPNSNTIRWTLSNAFCSDQDYVVITNNNPTDPVASTPTPNTCDGTAVINGNNPLNGTGLWSVKSGGGTIADLSSTATTVSGMPGGLSEYTWTITKVGCSESADVSVTNRAVTADAGLDIDNVCGIEPAISTVTLNAVAPNLSLGQTGNWTVITSSGAIQTPTLFNTAVNGMDDGTNTFRWTISNGTCSATDQVSVFVYIPTTANAGGDFEACADLPDSEALTGNTPAAGRGIGSWLLISGGGSILDATSAVTSVSNLASDENVFQWTIDHNGCTSTDQVIITNNFVTSDAGSDQAICVDNTTLAANDPQVFNNGLAQPAGQWTLIQGTGNFADNTLYNTTVSNLSTAVTNIFRWTVTKGSCSDFDEVQITNNEFIISAGPDQIPVCDDFANLDAQQPGIGTGLWTITSGGGTFTNETLYNTSVTSLTANENIFRWTVTRTNCSAFSEVTIWNDKVVALAGVDDNICVTSTNLAGGLPPVGSSGNWVAILGGASITTPTLNTTGVTNLGDGQNTFRWTITKGICSDFDEVDIFNDTPTTASVEGDKEVCSNNSVLNVLVAPIVGTGVWTAIDNAATIPTPSSYNAVVSGLNRGINTFRWRVTNNACTSDDLLVITNNIVVANAGTDRSTACADTYILPGQNPVQGLGVWTDISGSGAIIATNTLYNSSVSNIATGITQFRWTVLLGTCSDFDDVEITNNQITATAGVAQTTCNNSWPQLDGNDVSAIGGTGVWTTTGTANITSPTLFNTGVISLMGGLNTFTWTVTSAVESCTSSADVGITYNGVTANAGINQETCSSSTFLAAGDPTPHTGIWTQISGNPAIIVNSLDRNTEVQGLTSGVIGFRWTVTNGLCSNFSDVLITNSSPQTALAGVGSPEVCSSAGVLIGNVPNYADGETGLWTKVNAGGTIADVTNNNTAVNNLQLGDNIYKWTLTKGVNVTCTSDIDVTILNNQVVANAGVVIDVCSTTAALSANNPLNTQGTGLWTKIGVNTATIVNPTLFNTTITNLAENTTHGFLWTVTQGTCFLSDNVDVNNLVVLSDAGVNQSTCNTTYQLSGNDATANGATGLWTTVGTASITTPTLNNTWVTNLGQGMNLFTWTITSSGGCVEISTVEITYNEVLANAGLDQEICVSSTNLAANQPAFGSGLWSQLSGPAVTFVEPTLNTTVISGLAGGSYSFRWTVSNNGCPGFDDVIVINSAPQTAIANVALAEVCNGNGTLIGNPLLGGETGLWSKVVAGGVITDPTSVNTTVTSLTSGLNTFKWTISKGNLVTCTSEAIVGITNSEVTASATADNLTSCDGTASLRGNDASLQGATGMWTVNTSATINNPTNNNTLASNLVALDNTFTWTVTKGACTAFENVIISNLQIIADAGSDAAVCSSTASFNAADPGTDQGVWTIINPVGIPVITDISLFNSQVTNLQPGANIFQWSVSGNGCSDDDFVTITNDTVMLAAGTITSVCAFEADLVANPLGSGQTGLWISAGANPIMQNSTNPTTHVTNLDFGTNTFFWTVTSAAGCNTAVEYQLINNSPTPADAGTDQTLCVNTTSLAANNPLYGSGIWSVFGGSGAIVDATDRTTVVNNLGQGTNVLRWTITYNGCTDYDDVDITNNSFTVNAGIDQPSLCTTEANLNATGELTGTWARISGGSTIQNATLFNTAVSDLTFGDNRFTWTVSKNGCDIVDEVILTSNFTETATTEADKEVCQADNVPITANSPSYGVGTWSRISGLGTIVDVTNNNTAVNSLGLGANTFRWTISYKSCSDENELIITNNAVVADAGNNQLNLCTDNTILAALTPAVGVGSWSLSSGAGIIANSLDENSSVSGLAQGDNIFMWSVVNGTCTTSADVIIRNNSPTQATVGADQSICNTTTNLSGNNPAVGTGIWTVFGTKATILTPTLYNTSVTVDAGSTNTFTWTITNGVCSSDASMDVINNSFTIYAGIDQTICINNATLSGDDPGTGTGAWTVLSGGAVFSNTAAFNASVSSLGSDTNVFRWTVTNNGCSAFDNVNIINKTVVASANDQQLCVGNTSLSGNDPSLINAQGVWSVVAPVDAQSFTENTLFNTAVSNLSVGKNYLRWKVYNASCADSVTIEIDYYIPTVDAGSNISDCANTVQLQGNLPPAGGSGLWTYLGSGTVADYSLNNTMVTNLDIGVNNFAWTITDKGCIATDLVDIINNLPENIAVVDNYVGCQSVFTLGAQQPTATGTGRWSVPFIAGGGSVVDETLYNTQVTVDRGTNILRWTITDTGCSAYKDFTVTNNLTAPDAGEDVSVCINEVGLAAADPGVDNGYWSIVGGAITEVFDNSTSNNATVTNLRKGNITFIWTVSNAFCSASDVMVVTNNTPVIDAGNDRTICEDYVTLAGNNPALEVNTTGLWTSSSLTGVIVNDTKYNSQVIDLESGANVYKWTVTNSICSISEEVTITSNRINVDAGVDRTVCDSIVALSAVTPTIGVWVRVNGTATFDDASTYNTTARNLSAFNKFRWTVQANGCTNYDEVDIYSTLPEIANTEIDKAICQATTTITANSPDYGVGETGIWTIPGSSSATIVTPTNRNTDIIGLDLGPNTFRWTISSNGSPNCATSNDITVTNNQVLADAGTDQRLCFTDANMNAGGAGTNSGVWTIVGASTAVIANNTLNNTSISNLNPGINTFKWTVTGTGCSAEDEVVLHNDIPTVPNAGADQYLCDNVAPLSANNPDVNRGTGIWKLEGGSGNIADVSQFNTTVSGLGNGRNTFSWTITLNACSLTSLMDIYNNSVNVNAGVPQIICADEYELSGNDPGVASGSWSVIGGSGIFDDTALNTTWVRSLAKGQNTLRWTVNDGTCENYDEVTIMNNLPVVPVVEGDKDVCSDFATIGVNPAPDYLNRESGLWINTAGGGIIADATAANTSVNGLTPAGNTFQWTVTKSTSGVDCSLSDEIIITNNTVTASTGSDKSVCGTTSTLSGNDPGTGVGTWTRLSGTGIIAQPSNYNTTVSNLSTGNNIFRWSIVRNACNDFADITITNNQYISNANPGGGSVLCEDFSEVIADIPPAGTSGMWSMFAGIGTFDDETSNTTYVRGLGQGVNTIHWTLSKDGCDTYTEFTITNNEVTTSAGGDQIVCTNVTNLNATAAPAGGSGFWTIVSGTGVIADISSSATSVSNLSLGSNIFRWRIDANACFDESTLVVSNNAFTVSAGADGISCGTSYTLAGDDPAPGTGLWTIEGGNGVFVDPSSNATVVNGLNNHANIFRWTVTKNGCTFSEIVTITNDLFIADAGGDQSVCTNSAYLGATNPIVGEGTGQWSAIVGSGTFTDATDGATLVTALGAGDNTLRWTITKGLCIDSDEVIITNNSVVASAGGNQTTCDDFANLSGSMSSTATGIWTGGIPSTVIVNPTSAVTQVTGLGTGNNTFTWTVTDNNCTDNFTVEIRSNYFDAYAGPDQVVTVNFATLAAQLPDVTAVGTWSVLNGNGAFVTVNDPATIVNNLAYGVNRFQWTVVWNACTSIDDVQVIYNAISADAGLDKAICEDFTQLDAVIPVVGSGVWTLIDGTGVFDDPTDPKTFVRGIPVESVNTYRWTVTKSGFSVYDEVIVVNNDFVITAGGDQTTCINSITMAAEAAGAGGVGSWTVIVGSGTFSDGTSHNTVVTGLSPTNNRFEWTVTRNSCTNSDMVDIYYSVPPVAAFEVDPPSGCTPVDVTFTNTSINGVKYRWDFGDRFLVENMLNTHDTTFTSLFDNDSTYNIQLVATSDRGCTDTVIHTVTAFGIPDVGFGASPITQLYPRATVNIENLSGSGYVDYQWTFGDGETRLDGVMVQNFSHTYATWGDFKITLSIFSNSCSDLDTQWVHILAPQPETTINPGLRASGCEDLAVDFQAYTNYADTFEWDFGDGGSSSLENPPYIYDTPGTYIVILKAGGPGTDGELVEVRRDTVKVFVVPYADFEALPDTVMLPDQPVICHNNSIDGDTYLWNFGSLGDSLSTEKSPIHYYTEAGVYTITLDVWTVNGCHADTMQYPIVVEPAGTFQFPNAFNPYSDYELNKTFKPLHRGIREYKLEIYNRWGEKVFESLDPELGWDGYIDGKIGAQDVYAWKLIGKYRNGTLFKATGNVTLLR